LHAKPWRSFHSTHKTLIFSVVPIFYYKCYLTLWVLLLHHHHWCGPQVVKNISNWLPPSF
jgi:hypothetical protein